MLHPSSWEHASGRLPSTCAIGEAFLNSTEIEYFTHGRYFAYGYYSFRRALLFGNDRIISYIAAELVQLGLEGCTSFRNRQITMIGLEDGSTLMHAVG